MRLSERIKVIEQALNLGLSTCVEISIEKIEHGDNSMPMFIQLNDYLWIQNMGESYEAFAVRTTAGALDVFRPRAPHEQLKLIAKHPKLTREKWLEKYSHITKGSANAKS